MELPSAFEEKMRKMLGAGYGEYLASLEQEPYQGLRVNTAKISVEEFLNISPYALEPVAWCPNGFYYEKKEKPAKHPFYFAGLYYIQEPSAMTTASLLPIEEGDVVLDLCAAPGGKSTELAAKLHGTGLLVSNDISNSRAKALLKNIEVFGVGNCLVTSEPPNVLAKRFPAFFDKILIDAPCSGEGMFRKQSNMVKAWENNGVELFVGLQRSILKEAVTMLKPGGMIIYSTCTFSKEENEQSVEYLLSLDPLLHLVELPLFDGFDKGHPEWGTTGSPELAKCRRLWPHRIKGEGHFVALVQKEPEEGVNGSGQEEIQRDLRMHQCVDKQGNVQADLRMHKDRGKYETSATEYIFSKEKLSQEAEDFIRAINHPFDLSRMDVQKERVFYIPEKMPFVKGLRILRCGLYMGDMKKNRFEPSQSLAMFLKASDFSNVLDLPPADERVIRYLKGETIDVTDPECSKCRDGLCLICVNGYPLGFGKLSKASMKNKYLPGWRWM